MVTSPASPAAVYTLTFAANDYAALQTVNPSDLDRLVDAFDGTPIASNWEPIRMFWETEGGRRPVSNFSDVAGGGLVFDARALEALGDLLEGRGELLPLDVQDDEEEYRLFNVTRVSDALDEDQSELKRFSSDGRIMRVVRFAFDADRLAGETIFKLVQRPNYNYVTEVFRERAEAAALTGFRWREPVWRAAPVSGVTR